MNELVDTLHSGNYSCVIRTAGGEVRTFHRRGVIDLFETYRDEPETLRGASLADKVVGKGAAALMALGGVSTVHADVISTPALQLLREAGVATRFGQEVPHIINRAGTGRCPLETACADLRTPAEIYPAIVAFVSNLQNK